jgi:hypothetical protein
VVNKSKIFRPYFLVPFNYRRSNTKFWNKITSFKQIIECSRSVLHQEKTWSTATGVTTTKEKRRPNFKTNLRGWELELNLSSPLKEEDRDKEVDNLP